MSIRVKINGEEKELSGEMTVAGLLRELGLDRRVAIVERNREIVKKDAADEVMVRDGDELELVRFVGGG